MNAFPNKKLIGYTFREQLADLVPMLLMSLLMCGCVLLTGTGCEILGLPDIVVLVIQVLVGVVIYLLLSMILKLHSDHMLKEIVVGFLQKRNR